MNTQCPGAPRQPDRPVWLARFKEATALFKTGVNGDRESVQEALRLLEELRAEVPDHLLIQAYYGGALCLLGRDLTDAVERSAHVIRGLKLLDQAVGRDPANFEVRVLRENICVNLPEMYFHRNATVVEDCQFLIACYEKYPESIGADLYFQFLYNLGLAYRNLGQDEASAAAFRKLCAASNDPKYQALLAPGATSGDSGSDGFGLLLQPLPVIIAAGEKLHQAALAGGKPEIQKACDFFAKAAALHPDQPLFNAYHADCLSLKGKTSASSGEMFASAIKAIKAMDAAVIGAPDNLRLRLLRANHSMRLPEMFFARTATAITDLEYLVAAAQRDPARAQASFTADEWNEIHYHLGLCYIRLGLRQESAAIWQDLRGGCNEEIRLRIENMDRNSLPPQLNPGLSLETNRAAFYTEAKRLHGLGVAGNQTAAQKGFELWQQAHAADPGDPVAEGYYGSSLALSGRDATEINTMFGNAIKGLKHLNAALGRDPDNWELRLLRGYLSYSLPEVFFHGTGQAIQDFQYLTAAYEHNQALFAKELYDQIAADLKKARQRLA